MVPQQAINIDRHLEKVHGMYSYTDSNGWYNVGTCEGSYQVYQINIWGLQNQMTTRGTAVV